MQLIPSEFLALDRRARANMPFHDLEQRAPGERIGDFQEVILAFSPERAMVEAARCIHCPNPAPCMVACPAHNDIPSAILLIEHGRVSEAAAVYHQTSSLPYVCGRVCPHEQLCQGSCVLNKHHQPVLTGHLEVFALEWEHENDPFVIKKAPASGKKVAVVGAGPAGMSCAHLLLEKGHEVTIFDAKPAPGGLMVYG